MSTKKEKQQYAIQKFGETIDPEEHLNSESFRKHNLRFFRERVVGITQVELARQLGVTPQWVIEWENIKKPHRVPGAKQIEPLCRILGCRPIDLYSDFRAEYLEGILDDMLELIVADFHQNIRSNLVARKTLAMRQFEILSQARDYQNDKKAIVARDSESSTKEVEMHKRRYTIPPEDDDDDEDDDDIQDGEVID